MMPENITFLIDINPVWIILYLFIGGVISVFMSHYVEGIRNSTLALSFLWLPLVSLIWTEQLFRFLFLSKGNK